MLLCWTEREGEKEGRCPSHWKLFFRIPDRLIIQAVFFSFFETFFHLIKFGYLLLLVVLRPNSILKIRSIKSLCHIPSKFIIKPGSVKCDITMKCHHCINLRSSCQNFVMTKFDVIFSFSDLLNLAHSGGHALSFDCC